MTHNTLTPMVILQVNGEEIAQKDIRAIRSIKLTQHEKKADTGTIVFSDPDAEIFDSRTYRKGAKVVLIMGWSMALEARGPYYVKSQKIVFPEDGDAQLTVEFQDMSHIMNKRQQQRRFDHYRCAEVIQQIAEEHNLGYEIEEPQNVRFTDNAPLIQANVSNARLLQQLSERYGYVWGVEGETLYFRRPIDLEAIGQQAEVPVLSYRINDWSLMSFSPEIKFTGGRKRKGSQQTCGNVTFYDGDDEDHGIFKISGFGRNEISGALPQMREIIEARAGQDTDDDEPAATGSTNSTRNSGGEILRRGRHSFDNIRTILGPERFPGNINVDNDTNEESEPGDESNSATPDTQEEAERRQAGKAVRASEIVEGTAVPTIAGMRYRPQMAVILTGVGERLSGRFRIVEVTHTISDVFKTVLKLKRQTFRPSAQDEEQISEAAERQLGTEQTSSEGPPPQTTVTHERVYASDITAKTGKRFTVNGERTVR